MTPSEALQAIRAVVVARKSATKGPWVAYLTNSSRYMCNVVAPDDGTDVALIGATDIDEQNANTSFVALAGSTDWAAVLEALEGK